MLNPNQRANKKKMKVIFWVQYNIAHLFLKLTFKVSFSYLLEFFLLTLSTPFFKELEV